jgi:thymidylate synthase (FAD)
MGMADAAGRYQAALEDGEAPQQARDFLPNSVKTEIVATWNLAQVLHVLKMRAVKPAHPQMIALMGLWISEIRAWFPEFLDISRHIWSPRGVNEEMERAD